MIGFIASQVPIAWHSVKHNYVSHSSSEAEFRQLAVSMNWGLWYGRLLGELGFPQGPVDFYCDNNVAIRTISRPSGASRSMQHLDKYYFYVQQFQSQFRVSHRPGKLLSADLLTKPLGGVKMEQLRTLVGVHPPPPDIVEYL